MARSADAAGPVVLRRMPKAAGGVPAALSRMTVAAAPAGRAAPPRTGF